MQAFRKAYRQGHEYQSAGIHAMELTQEGSSSYDCSIKRTRD